MSGHLLENPDKLQDLQDDLESFFHLIFYIIITELPTQGFMEPVEIILADVYDSGNWNEYREQWVGGDGKSMMILTRRRIGASFEFPGNEPLNEWIIDALGALREYYLHIASKRLQKGGSDSNNIEPQMMLYDHSFLDSAFKKALKRIDWTDNRKKDAQASSKHLLKISRPTRASSTSHKVSDGSLKRSRDDDDDERELRPKRPRSALQSVHTPPRTSANAALARQKEPLQSPNSPTRSSLRRRRSGRLRGGKQT